MVQVPLKPTAPTNLKVLTTCYGAMLGACLRTHRRSAVRSAWLPPSVVIEVKILQEWYLQIHCSFASFKNLDQTEE